MADLKIGDIVTLKSGGPKMTVTSAPEDDGSGGKVVHCSWFGGEKHNQLEHSSFNPGALQKLDSDFF
jgi:uncharacterized protein YodC (DUF2158 family)